MNIFVLDIKPELAAQYHCDKHVVKMILETAQIMSTVVISKLPNVDGLLYKPTHRNHPCTLWAGESLDNFLWLGQLGLELMKEFEYRYNKTHKSGKVIMDALLMGSMDQLKWDHNCRTPFAQAMPNIYRNEDPVKAYRDYYINEKNHLLTYTNRRKPEWITE